MATKGSVRRKTVKEIFQDNKILSEEQLNKALEETKKTNEPLQSAVVRLNLMSRVDLLRTLSQEWNVKAVNLDDIEIDPETVKVIPEAAAKRHRAIPFVKEDNVLFVAMADPRDFFVIEDIQLRTNFEVQPYLALPEDISKILEKTYGMATSLPKVDQIISGLKEGEEEISVGKVEEKLDVAEIDASAPEVEKLVNAIIISALQQKASDIHIEPFENKFICRYRIDGNLTESSFQIPYSFRNALIAKIKIMTEQMDITERRRPQDGRIQVVAKGNPVEFRVNILPTVFGESCVMRVLDRASVRVDVEKLGFLKDTQEKLRVCVTKPYGLVLVCGPTGSGKSTTLYAVLNSINTPDSKILTAENPVEYNLPGIVQVNVIQEIGFDFPAALRAFLRQDPDVIMVGEIRDKETAQIAMEAAMTGHLVFSTIHTNDAPSAVARIHEMGVPTFLISSSVECVLAQRLVRRVCGECKQKIQMTEEYLKVFQQYKIDTSNATLYKGRGCDVCRGTGYKGRAGIHELLVMDDEIRRLLLSEIAAGPIRELARKNGMRTLLEDGLVKVTMGVTTMEEVLGSAQ
ncbi:MAG: Flp pilus assembly complex ATPase component TadA [Elusimicrobia bacterium]|nr:Flp pilus assembly complex ATPase component TadA [Candidatus Liberimonas magnetica]